MSMESLRIENKYVCVCV